MAAAEDRLEPPRVSQLGTFRGLAYVQYDGVFAGQTSTGAFRVPYRITAPARRALANGAVLVEPPHFAIGLGALNLHMGPDFLLGRRFVHAGVGYSTTSFGPGADRRILDPSVPGVFIEGGVDDDGGRTDNEIITDFARALVTDSRGRAMAGRVTHRYLTGFSDSSIPVLRLVTSGLGDGVFDLAVPFTTVSGFDPQGTLAAGDFGGKLLIVNSEADDSTHLVDGGGHPGQYRFFTVAGTPHVPDPLTPFFSNRTTPANWQFELRARFLATDLWVKGGEAPPPSTHLATSADGALARDAKGNAITVDSNGRSVSRLPFVELGEARFVTGFLGTFDNVNTVGGLGFTSHQAYLGAFAQKAMNYVRAGAMLPEEVPAMLQRARLCPPLTVTQTYRDHYDNFVSLRSCP